jgi:HK97 family phage major capsid protein
MDPMTIRKALTVADGTSDYLIPELVDGAIRDYTAVEPVIYNAVSRVPWASNVYFVRKRTANPTASWAVDGGSLPAATKTTHTRVSVPVAYLYTRGEVTGPMQKAAGSLVNALAMEIEAHSRALVEQLSDDIWAATGAADDLYGILHQIETSTVMNAGSGVVTVSGALSLASLDKAIDNSRGQVDLIVASRATRRAIAALLQAQQQFVDKVEIQAGFRVLAYDGLPIVTDLANESTTKIAFIKRADAKLLVHEDFTYEELAKTKDSTDFMIKGYFGFALEGRPTELTGYTAIAN